MATYLQGSTDYIPQIQPFRPDYNFLGNIMQTRQTKYDAAKKKISDLYGSLLYSPMLRDSNIKRRDEFFKVIDQDIKKISGMDLSLQQNVDAAENVFKGFYEDKNMINDMVKTKKAYAELEKADSLKGCLDPEKCGGQYWDDGVKALQYRMEEFKNATDEEALNYNIGEFTPYFEWKSKAIKAAKDLNYGVTKDDITNEWIVTNTNGELVSGGLYSLFKDLYGDDPRIKANYDTQSYVLRKDNVKANAAKFGSEEEAEKNYIQTMMQNGLKKLQNNHKYMSDVYDNLNSRQLQLEKQKAQKGLTLKEEQYYQQVLKDKETAALQKATIQSDIDNVNNDLKSADLRSFRNRVDIAVANVLKDDDLKSLGESLANINKKQTVQANPYGVNAQQAAITRQNKLLDFELDKQKMYIKHDLDMKLEDYKEFGKLSKAGQNPNEPEAIEDAEDPNTKITLNVDENPEAGFEMTRNDLHTIQAKANSMSSDYIYNMVIAAQKAAKAGSAGAKQYLEKIVGNVTISDRESLSKAMSAKKNTPRAAFDLTMKIVPEDKNPTGDYAWAQPTLQKYATQIHDIKTTNDAYYATIKHMVNSNKKVISEIKKTVSAENPVAKYADLLVTSSGFLYTDKEAPAEFIQKYISKKQAEGDYNVDEGDAEDAYAALKTQFYMTYNTTPGVSLKQGSGLIKDYQGTGYIGGTSLSYQGVDAKNKTKVLNDVTDATTKILANPTGFTGVFGDASKESFENEDSEAVKNALLGILNDIRTTNPKEKGARPIFNVKLSPFAAENENLAAITFSNFDPEYIKKYVGTKDNPGILAGKDLSKITLFYDKGLETAFKKESEASNITSILKVNKNYSIDSFPKAGTVDLEYDPDTDEVSIVYHKKIYNKGKEDYQHITYNPKTLSDINAVEKQLITILREQESRNIAADEAIRTIMKNK